MLHINRSFKTSVMLSCITVLFACSSTPQSEIEYKQSRSLPSLEVPPDLITPAVDKNVQIPTVLTTALTGQPTKISTGEEISVKRDGSLRWLVIKGETPQLKQRIRNFWKDRGFEIQEDTHSGIIDTSWEENLGMASKSSISGLLRKAFSVLYSSSTRDQFRVRFEPGTLPGTTEIYLTHRGMEQIIRNESPMWQPRPADPTLEAEMLKRLVIYLGTNEDKANDIKNDLTRTTPARASITQDAQGLPMIIVSEDYPNTWRRTGLALDHLGAKIEDQNRTLDPKRGNYQFRIKDPSKTSEPAPGWLSKLFSNDKDKNPYFELRLLDQDKETHIMLFDKVGNRDNSPMAQRLLTLLQEQLK